MKSATITMFIIAALTCNCAMVETDGVAKTTRTILFASSGKGLNVTPEGWMFEEFDAAKVPLSLIRTFGTAFAAWTAMRGMLGLSADHVKIETGAQGVTKAANAGAEATKQLGIKTKGAVDILKNTPSTALP